MRVRRSTGWSSGEGRSWPIRSGSVLREGIARPGRDPDRGVRPAAHRGGPAQLAVPARPAHRCLRADSEPGDRLKSASPARSRVPHAGRVGAARGHLDRLAAQSPGLAGQASRRSRGYMPKSCASSAAWSASASWSRGRAVEAQARKVLEKAGARWTRWSSSLPHQPRLDPRLLSDLRAQSPRARWR